jgi:hypothetical protein
MQESKKKKYSENNNNNNNNNNQMGRYHVQESKQQNCLSDLLWESNWSFAEEL